MEYVEAFSYILDAAEDHNLHVISPTVRKGRGEGQEAWWLAQFLGACEADTTYDCDIDAIHAWDLVRRTTSHPHTRARRHQPTRGVRSTTTTARRPSGRATRASWRR